MDLASAPLIHLSGFAAFNALAAFLIWQALKAITASRDFRESDALSSARYPTRASGFLVGAYALACLLFQPVIRDSPWSGVALCYVSLFCFYSVTFIISCLAAAKRPTLQSIYYAVHSAMLGFFTFLLAGAVAAGF